MWHIVPAEVDQRGQQHRKGSTALRLPQCNVIKAVRREGQESKGPSHADRKFRNGAMDSIAAIGRIQVSKIVEDQESSTADFGGAQLSVPERSLVRVVGVHVDPVKVSIVKFRQHVLRKPTMASNASIGRDLWVEPGEIDIDEMKLDGRRSRENVLCELALERTELCNAAIRRQL